MGSLNKVMLIGRVCNDLDLKYTPSGKWLVELRVAINYTKDKADFFSVRVWEKQAEQAATYLKKGSGVYIEGHLSTNSWVEKDGKNRSRMEITADRVQFLGGKDNNDAPEAVEQPKPKAISFVNFGNLDEEVPF